MIIMTPAPPSGLERGIICDFFWTIFRFLEFLTLTDMAGEEGPSHPGLLLVTRATAITALTAGIVFTLAAEFL